MDKKTIGERIRAVRESAKLSQDDFAQATSVTNVTISRYEKDHRTPDAGFLNRLVELYGCDPGWLLTGSGETRPYPAPSTDKSDLELMLYRILNEGDMTKETAVRAVLTALDPGEGTLAEVKKKRA